MKSVEAAFPIIQNASKHHFGTLSTGPSGALSFRFMTVTNGAQPLTSIESDQSFQGQPQRALNATRAQLLTAANQA